MRPYRADPDQFVDADRPVHVLDLRFAEVPQLEKAVHQQSRRRSRSGRAYEFRAHLGHARVLRTFTAPADAEAIESALRLAEKRAVEIGLAGWLPWVYEERAALALVLGDETQRRTHLEEARRLYETIGATGHLERLAERVGSARTEAAARG